MLAIVGNGPCRRLQAASLVQASYNEGYRSDGLRKQMMIGSIMALVIAYQSAAPAPRTHDSVTFRHQVASVSQVVQALGKQVGLELSVAPALVNEPVCVAVRDVTLKDLMERIADVTGADWIKGTRGLTLAPSITKAREQSRLEEATRRAQLQEWFDATQAALMRPYDEETIGATLQKTRELYRRVRAGEGGTYRQLLGVRKESPIERALRRMVLALGVDTISRLALDERVVYSVSPTAMQRRMPAGATAALQQLEKEAATWLAAYQRLPADDSDEPEWIRDELAARLKSGSIEVLLILECALTDGLRPAVTAALHLYDSRGVRIAEASDVLSVPEAHGADDPSARTRPDPTDPEIPLTPETKELRDALEATRQRSDDRSGDKAFSVIRERLLDPVSLDPCSPGTTDFLFALADLKGLDVVACVPDFTLTMVKAPPTFLRLGLLTRELERFGLLRLTVDHNWCLATSPFPHTERTLRLDRKALRNYLVRTAKGSVSLDALADFAATTSLDRLFLTEMYRTEVLELTPGPDEPGSLLPFYGSLGESQRRALKRGDRLVFGALTPLQQAKIHRAVFGPRENSFSETLSLEYATDEAPASPEGPEPNEPLRGDDRQQPKDSPPMSGQVEIEVNEWRLEPTETLPRGIPRDAVVTMTTQQVTQIFDADSTESNRQSGLDANAVAWTMFMNERPELFAHAEKWPTPKRFRIARGSEHEIRLVFGPRLSARSVLLDRRPPESATYTWETLPPDVRREIEARLAAFREEFKNAKPGEFGIEDLVHRPRRPPPPPE